MKRDPVTVAFDLMVSQCETWIQRAAPELPKSDSWDSLDSWDFWLQQAKEDARLLGQSWRAIYQAFADLVMEDPSPVIWEAVWRTLNNREIKEVENFHFRNWQKCWKDFQDLCQEKDWADADMIRPVLSLAVEHRLQADMEKDSS